MNIVDSMNGWACGFLSAGPSNREDRIIHTTDGGQNWQFQRHPVGPTASMLWDISFIDLQNDRCIGDAGKILHTTDGGNNWIYDTSGVTNDLWSVHFVDINKGWAVGDNGTIIKYSGGGIEFTKKANASPLAIASNSFLPSIVIGYQLPTKIKGNLKIYDVPGRVVKILVDRVQEPGNYTVHWNAERLTSSLYFAKFEARNYKM